MTYAFDIDGTLTPDPKRMGDMMSSLVRAGNRVIVLTGAIRGTEITRPERIAQLNSLGIHHDEHYDEIFISVGGDMVEVARGKGKVCREEKVDMVFEDNEDFIRFIRTMSPQTITMMVRA